MKLAVAFVAVLGGTAAADVTIATQDDDTLTITTVSHDKLKRVFSGPTGTNPVYVFSDAHTLWVYAWSNEQGTYVTKIVDGKASFVGSFTYKDFAATTNEPMTLHAGTSGAVWLERCVAEDAKGRCTKTGYLRLDGDKPVLSTAAPATVLDEEPGAMSELAAPPRGYAFHLREHGGNWGMQNAVTCSAPGGKGGIWSSAMQTADTAWWVMENPAVLAIAAYDPMTRAMAQRGPGDVIDLDTGLPVPRDPAAPPAPPPKPHATVYMEACRDILDDVYILPDGLWGAEKGKSIRIKRGAKLLGTVHGYAPRVAPAAASP